MTKYTVAIKGDEEATARSTDDLDAALDWFTNAVTEVVEDEGSLSFASLAVDGVIWAQATEHGISPGGQLVELRAA